MKCFFCSGEHESYYKFVANLKNSYVYLNNEQAFRGRCAVITKKHYTELFQMDRDELAGYICEVARVAKAVSIAFNADKINYCICGDIDSHIHFHIVPKHKGAKDWGVQFTMSDPPEKQVLLDDQQYQEIIEKIQKYLLQ